MNRKKALLITVIVVMLAAPMSVYSAFGMNLGMAFNTMPDEDEGQIFMIGISLQPDIEFGNWGIGLDTTFNFQIAGDDTFRFMTENWVPEFEEDDTFLDKTRKTASLYLPIFRYVRYGHKGDPLYGQIGMFDSYTLGTGIFLDGYTNTRFVPRNRITGAVFDIDGRLFNFPYIGLETVAGSITDFDVLGARLYSRPLSFLSVPVIKDIQIGASYVTDRKPDALDSISDNPFDTGDDPEAVYMFGADLIMPVASFSMFSMNLFTDYALQSRPHHGDQLASAFRTGFRGRAVGLINYLADFTIPNNNYVPYYFSRTYDDNRRAKYEADGLSFKDDGVYYLRGSAGFDLFQENLMFNLLISAEVDSNDFSIDKPSMTASFGLGEDLVPFFFFDGSYTKNFEEGEVTDFSSFLDGVLAPNRNSVIEINGNIKYKLLLTKVSVQVAFDEQKNMDVSTTVAGDINLDGLFGFLQ